MNAADYYDWWQYSGTGLGTTSPGERYKQLKREISAAGVNVVAVSEFIEQNPDAVDTDMWRKMYVFGLEGMQVKLMAEALDAIGASRTAESVRNAKSLLAELPSFEDLQQGAELDRSALQQAMQNLHAQMLTMFPDALDGAPPEIREHVEENLPRAKQSANAETREVIAVLLDRYAAANGDVLEADVEKHGDPRQAPGFDPEQFMEELLEQNERLAGFRDQRGELAELRKKLDTFEKLIANESPKSRKLQLQRQLVLREYHRYKAYDSEDLTVEVQQWLHDVERLRTEHPDAFQPRATDDDAINAKLSAIGEYRVEFYGGEPRIDWPWIPELQGGWTPLALVFYVFLGDSQQQAQVYDSLIAAWEELKPKLPRLLATARDEIIRQFRDVYADQLWDEELAEYEDDEGEISDQQILAHVVGGCVTLQYSEYEGITRSLTFGVDWDDEHGCEIGITDDGEIAGFE
jgi:hypothetical protein